MKISRNGSDDFKRERQRIIDFRNEFEDLCNKYSIKLSTTILPPNDEQSDIVIQPLREFVEIETLIIEPNSGHYILSQSVKGDL